MADFLSALTSGTTPGSVTAGFEPYEILLGRAVFDLGEEFDRSAIKAFQYFPERITDTRSPNYSQKEIPGGSHPLYQFVSGGERVIAFDAIFTNDSSGEGDAGGLIGGVLGFLGGQETANKKINSNARIDVVDIAAVIEELRKFTYPTYPDKISKPPPLIVFYLPGSGIVSADGARDSIVGILGRCDVTYEAFHRNGTPRIAVVGLEIREVVQTSSTWQFANWNTKKSDRSYQRIFRDKP